MGLPPLEINLTIEQELMLIKMKDDINSCRDLSALREAVIELTRQNMIMRNVVAKMAKS